MRNMSKRKLTSTGPFIVYALVDPRTDERRYIGKSCSGKYRPERHGQPGPLAADHTHKGNWIRSLQALVPPLSYTWVTLEECATGEELPAAEIKWIARGRELGWPLANHTDGGEGMLGHTLPAEARAKIGAANSRRGQSPETREKIRQARQGVPNPASAGDNNPSRRLRENVARGEGHWRAKLTVVQVEEIKARVAKGESQNSLTTVYGVSAATINRVIKGIAWTAPKEKDEALAQIDGKPHVNETIVREIRRRYDAGASTGELAAAFHISTQQVRRIAYRQAWADLPDEEPTASSSDS